MQTQFAALLQSLAGDLRFAFRHFSRHSATTALIVVVLALSAGANTLIVVMFQAAFLRPAPEVPADPSHALVWMQERSTPTARWRLVNFTGAEYAALAARRETFASVAAWTDEYAIVARVDSAAARHAPITFVSPDYFTTLGVPLSHGRHLLGGMDAGADFSAVIAARAATELFGSPAMALGKWLIVNKTPVEIVGVAPLRFRGAMKDDVEPVLFLPMSLRRDVIGSSERWMAEERALQVFGRLAGGANFERATAAAQQIALGTLPDSAVRVGMVRRVEVRHLGAVPPWDAGEELILIFALIAAGGILILLVGWLNVSSLMVAAAVARRQEIAVRLALGATRRRILRQLATESALISVVAATGGVAAACALIARVDAGYVTGMNLMPDGGTIAFMFALALATGILFGLSPALHAMRGVAGAMRDSGLGATGRSRLQRGLVIAQIALSQPLLVFLLLVMQMVVAGYQPIVPETSRNVVAATFSPNRDPRQAELGPAQVATLALRLAARPEVAAVVPAAAALEVREVRVPDPDRRDADDVGVFAAIHVHGSAPGWFALLDVPVVLGRDVALADTASTDRPVVIGLDLARALYGDRNPLGQIIQASSLPGKPETTASMTVVGVFDSRVRTPGMSALRSESDGAVPFRVYTAFGQGWKKDALLIRTRGQAAGFLPDLQRFVATEAPLLPVVAVRTLQQLDDEGLRATWLYSLAAALGGLVALALASLGLYGVISLSVRQRTREIGIRIALGAEPLRIARLFLVSGLRSAALGLAIGLPVTLAGLQVLIAQGEMRMSATKPLLTGLLITVLLLTVATLATWIPARRAARIDPGLSLRLD